jgi:hypothetical protein
MYSISMYRIHKRLFHDFCDNNIEIYQDFIKTIREDYLLIMQELFNTPDIPNIRHSIHKLFSVIVLLDCSNEEMIYLCKLILNIDKKDTNIQLYLPYVEMILQYDKANLGL